MQIVKKHLEWVVFFAGLLVLALMDPTTVGPSFCLFDQLGIEFCPGEGLGHSIAYTFRADFNAALEAHFLGPFAAVILSLRIFYIWKEIYFNNQNKKRDKTDG